MARAWLTEAVTDEAFARVRIICRREDGAVLMMKWQDPVEGFELWEPPGGGVEPGETAEEAAHRELAEETGFTAEFLAPPTPVARDYRWKGKHYAHTEGFFLADVAGEPDSSGFTPSEVRTFRGWAYVRPEEIASLDARVEPPALVEVLGQMGVDRG